MVLKKPGNDNTALNTMVIPGYRKCVGCKKMQLGKESFNGTGNIYFFFKNNFIYLCLYFCPCWDFVALHMI